MTRKPLYVIALSTWFIASAAQADFALGAKAGTLGLGVEGTFSLSDYFNVRTGINSYSADFEETASDIRYNGDLDLRSAALLLDWHPFGGTFRLSAGFVRNENEVQMRATPTANVNIGGRDTTPAELGTIRGDITFKKNVPYLGLGWGNAVGRGSAFGFNAEIGALFQGKPKVALRSEGGTLSNNTVLTDRLRTEEQEVQNDLDDYKIYPVLSLGFSYRF